jgi:threonine aldolase
MNRIATYCREHFYLNEYLDEYLKDLDILLKSDERREEGNGWLAKEIDGLCALLSEEGCDTDGKRALIRELSETYMKKQLDLIPFESHPLKMMCFDESIERQFELVDIMHRHFDGYEALKEGDYGCSLDLGRPHRTAEVEKVLAEYFHCEDAALVRGGGTGAIRALCLALLKRGSRVLVHDAPIYKTTMTTFEAMGTELIRADFNDPDDVQKHLRDADVVYIQRVRQQLSDTYDTIELIGEIRKTAQDIPIVVDENYAVNKVRELGAACGGDASVFSGFKLLGLPGIGVVVGKKDLIAKVHEQNYSGGGQVQGPEASELLRSLVNNPILLAVQDRSVDQIADRLSSGEVSHVEKAVKANLEERIILVKLDLPIAEEVMAEAVKLGALPYPVGSESRYEVQSLFYRVAKVMLDKDPIFRKYVIRINPMRSGPDTVIRILDEAIRKVLDI